MAWLTKGQPWCASCHGKPGVFSRGFLTRALSCFVGQSIGQCPFLPLLSLMSLLPFFSFLTFWRQGKSRPSSCSAVFEKQKTGEALLKKSLFVAFFTVSCHDNLVELRSVSTPFEGGDRKRSRACKSDRFADHLCVQTLSVLVPSPLCRMPFAHVEKRRSSERASKLGTAYNERLP